MFRATRRAYSVKLSSRVALNYGIIERREKLSSRQRKERICLCNSAIFGACFAGGLKGSWGRLVARGHCVGDPDLNFRISSQDSVPRPLDWACPGLLGQNSTVCNLASGVFIRPCINRVLLSFVIASVVHMN